MRNAEPESRRIEIENIPLEIFLGNTTSKYFVHLESAFRSDHILFSTGGNAGEPTLSGLRTTVEVILVMETLKDLKNSYEKWVVTNPEMVGEVETTAKWISYFIAGRLSDSSLASELIYSLSNILSLYNDTIINEKHCPKESVLMDCGPTQTKKDSHTCNRLKVLLCTLEYSEVFIEISVKRIYGIRGKWIIVAMLQIIKAAGRFFLLKYSTDQIITSPIIPTLNRRAFIKSKKAKESTLPTSSIVGNDIMDTQKLPISTHASFTFQLKRSGRIVRKVEGAPPLQYRNFTLHEEMEAYQRDIKKSDLRRPLLKAEYLYIAKPLIHLASMRVMGGRRRWPQYLLALIIDMYSIQLYYKNRNLMTKQEKMELSRRCLNLLLYLMRSPFYEQFTQKRLEYTMDTLVRNIPFVNIIINPLMEYIPRWQDTYFYLWST